MRDQMTISKRAKGFPVNLTLQHWFIIQQLYPWLQSVGAADEDTDAAIKLVPNYKVTPIMIAEAVAGKDCLSALYKSRTVRVRAEMLPGMIRLLKLAAMFTPGGQLGATLWRRACKLESIGELDMLADASR